MNCEHRNRVGDNYGETCQDCGNVPGLRPGGGWSFMFIETGGGY